MTLNIRTVHRYLAYIIGLQVFLWLLGGVAFAWIPFQSLVKGGAVLAEQEPTALPDGWWRQLDTLPANLAPQGEVSISESAQGALLFFRAEDERHWLRLADGSIDSSPSVDEVDAFASSLYAGTGELVSVERIQSPDAQIFGLVHELYGREDVWQARFDDASGTRFYFDGATGRYLTVRNHFWVVYDALWRLHIMDYRGGEDFNNWLLSVFSVSALLFALSGALLGIQRLSRRYGKRRSGSSAKAQA